MIGPLPGFSTRIVWIVAAVVGAQRAAPLGAADPVRDLIRDGRYARAAESARSALDELGPCASERVDLECLRAEALRRGNGKFAPETLELAGHSASLAAQLFGADDPRTAEPLLQLGALRLVRGEFAEAKTALERSLELLHGASRNGDPREATALAYLAIEIAKGENDLPQAIVRLDEADHVLDRLEPGESPERAWILDMRGNVLQWLVRTEEALSAYSRALAMRLRTQRSDHPLLVLSLLNTGAMLDQEGRLPEARARYEEVLALLLDGGEIAWIPGDVYPKLGSIWHQLGETERARSCFECARAELEAGGQKETAAYARVLDSLAQFAFDRSEFAQAGDLLRAELAILDGAQNVDPGARAGAHLLLAWTDLYTGSLDGAREQVSLARAIDEAEDRPGGLPDCDEVEAWIAYGRGDLEHSRVLLRRVVQSRDGSRAWDQRAEAQARYQLSRVELVLGDVDAALDEALEAERCAREEWARSALGLEELSSILLEEKSTTLALQRNVGVAVGAAVRSARPRVAEPVWNALLLSRDRVFRESAERVEIARASKAPELASAAAKLADARLRLSGLYVQSRRTGDVHRFEEAISKARSEREAAERELSAQEREAGAARTALSDLSALSRALEPGAALVRFCLAQAPPASREDFSTWLNWVPCYYAFVLGGGAETPKTFELGPATEIDALVDRLLRAIRIGMPLHDYIPVAAELRRRILDPLLPELRKARVLDLVPDGALHLVPFPALCSEAGDFLVELGPTFHLLQTEQDILISRGTETTGTGLLALGDPAFAAAVDADAPEIAGGSEGSGALAARSGATFGTWPTLPQTRTEVERIAGIWKDGRLANERVDLLEGRSATERALREGVRGRRVVHIATHGFYEDAPGSGPGANPRGVSSGGGADSGPAVVGRRDGLPYLRSGLVFASAGEPCTHVLPEDDGILTTEEVLGLDLSGVEWVVLSACDTGLGEIHALDGVLGLRRALRIAGARTVIGSLWPVDDRWTREWMEALYRARFVDRLSTPESMRAASRAVLAELRAEHLEPLPLWWASFVAVGDPR